MCPVATMTLEEYYRAFQACISVETDLPPKVAGAVVAAHSLGLSTQELRAFLAESTAFTSVSVALIRETISPQALQCIVDARSDGCVYPKDVLVRCFREKMFVTSSSTSSIPASRRSSQDWLVGPIWVGSRPGTG